MNILSQVLVIGTALALGAVASAGSEHWTLHRLSIDPIRPENRRIFVGAGEKIRVEFKNESDREAVKVFPEPPMIVRQVGARTNCEIDGGVWARDSVYLSADEEILLVLEFSGDLNHLVAYDTGNCRKLGDLDVSGGRWSVIGSEIVLGTQCRTRDVASCKKKREIPVSKLCNSASGDGNE
jgi:hypothetical protein